MHRPRIGIPLCLDDRERWRPGRAYLYIDRRYADAITAAGGLALHLPICPDAEHLVETLDGLLIPGGDDFPSPRPLPPDVALELVPEAQRRFDTSLLEAARRANLPILGICYGMQLLAVTAGGELEPHLPSAPHRATVPRLEHRLPEHDRHPIEVEADGRLAGAIGAGRKRVNSLHHQAVASTGTHHRVAARSPDGVIEAIELCQHDETRWEVGVQWHPEKQPEGLSEQLFTAFVEAARAGTS